METQDSDDTKEARSLHGLDMRLERRYEREIVALSKSDDFYDAGKKAGVLWALKKLRAFRGKSHIDEAERLAPGETP